MRIEVLVATMFQKDLCKYKDMNIQTDAIFINQDNRHEFEQITINNKNVKIITTDDRGVSKSRNTALLNATGDICLIADDDIIYKDDYEKTIQNAFEEIPHADIIIFNTTMLNCKGLIARKDIKKVRRSPKYKTYGAVRIAFRLKSIRKSNIWFNLNFGPGAVFAAGEDSLIVRDANRHGLKIYEHPANIANVDYSTSTWFKGYNEKYFYDKGAFLAAAYRNSKHILKYYFMLKMSRHSKLSIFEISKLIRDGINGYESLMSYGEYEKTEKK